MTKTKKIMITTCLALGLTAACSDDSGGGNGGQLDGGGGTQDQGGKKDSGAASALQVVVNKLVLPRSEADYATDLDGDGKKENQVGKLLAAFKVLNPSYDVHKDFADFVAKGELLMLFDLLARGIANDPAAQLRFFLGADTDKDPKNNFSGSATLGIDPTSPRDLTLKAGITNRKLSAGPGTMTIPVPIGSTPTLVTIKNARVTATLATSGMSSGVISGAIPQADVDNKLVPALAKVLDELWKKPDTTPATKSMLKSLDQDNDGTISNKDLKHNGLVGALFSADVDLDGDKTKDAVSMGVGFAAIKCKIKK